MKILISAAFILLLVIPDHLAASRGTFRLPELPEPDLYGNLLLGQASTEKKVKPVSFSHWQHRQYYTCSVCHEELGMAMEKGATGIKEIDNQEGRYCGACHNGVTAFPVTDKEKCQICHNGDKGFSRGKFTRFTKEYFPATPFGNRIDWVQALRERLIEPKAALRIQQQPVVFNKRLTLAAEWNFVPPAVFPHQEHSDWVSCAMCHPDLFNIKKKTTEHFLMSEILKGNFCGVCHLNVAFPMDDCRRCHPGMKDK